MKKDLPSPVKNKINMVLYACDTILRGYGQVLLQRNRISGVLVLIGISLGSLQMGFFSLIAAIVAYSVARIGRFPKKYIADGLYGFNAILVAVAMVHFFPLMPVLPLVIIALSILATLLENYFLKKKVPAYTFPFIGLTWISMFLFHAWLSPLAVPDDLPPMNFWWEGFTIIGHIYGEIIFQVGWVSGVVFFMAICCGSLRSALFGLLGALLSVLVARMIHVVPSEIAGGMFGFNAVLCALAFAGRSGKDWFSAFAAIVLSIFLTRSMSNAQLPMLTFPFVLSAWIVNVSRSWLGKIGDLR